MEGIKAFFGFTNTDSAAKLRCRLYLKDAMNYGKTVSPVPAFVTKLEEYFQSANPDDEDEQAHSAAVVVEDEDPFWIQWDEFKEDALTLLTTKPENNGIMPDGNFVAMWQHLEHGRQSGSTAPPVINPRRRSSIARVRLA